MLCRAECVLRAGYGLLRRLIELRMRRYWSTDTDAFYLLPSGRKQHRALMPKYANIVLKSASDDIVRTHATS
jgi:hypothetical protein